jgi:hypothetical protein
MTEQQPSGDSFGRFMGLVLMGAGVLWMAFCGLCAFGVMATVVTESSGSDAWGSTFAVLLISGVSAAAGYGVFIAGRSLWRAR